MIYGHARVSTKGQAKDGNGLDVQRAALKAAGAEEIYEEAELPKEFQDFLDTLE